MGTALDGCACWPTIWVGLDAGGGAAGGGGRSLGGVVNVAKV